MNNAGASGESNNASGGVNGAGAGGVNSAGAGGASGAGATSMSERFRYGFNAGYPNPTFNDQDFAGLGIRAGVTSERVSLPEQHLDRWGYDIELNDVKGYRALGMGELVGFLTSPTRAHSSAPSSATDDEASLYIPKNLYEPITTSDGKINPDNYWANYVYRTVSIYGEWIKTWEVWNEPDWVSDWQVTEAWASREPTPADLPRFHGSIFDYVRMLRVSSVAAKLADPSAKIATGGLGYANFLDALLRYSDEPNAGAINADFPATGKAYIDVVSFHHYPIYTQGNSESAVDGFLEQKATFAALIAKAKIQVGFECTETGAPHVALDGVPSGAAYAKNYLLKTMTLAPGAGIGGVHWFVLSDAKVSGQSTDPYAFMGLYQPVQSLTSPAQAQLTETGVAYRTLTSLLADAHYDDAATQSLALPENARGAAYQSSTPSDHRILVLWALPASNTSETAALTLDLPADRPLRQHLWDFSKTNTSELLSPTNSTLQVTLDATPRIFVEE